MSIIGINGIDENRLEEVMEIAKEKGRVELAAYDDGENIWLLEGTHRIEAAYRLELQVVLCMKDDEEKFENDIEDTDAKTVAELVEYLKDNFTGKETAYYESEFERIKFY